MPETPNRTSGFRHWLGFLVSGGAAFAVDAGTLEALLHLTPLSPFLARIVAIFCAMLVGWQMHRRLTFAVSAPPSVREFLAFASVGWTGAAVNYLVYAGLLLGFASLSPLAAMTISSLVAMAWSYLGYRFHVFR